MRDFVRLAERSGLHAGIITFPSGCMPDEQFLLIECALQFLDAAAKDGRDAVNRWIEMGRDGSMRVYAVSRDNRGEA